MIIHFKLCTLVEYVCLDRYSLDDMSIIKILWKGYKLKYLEIVDKFFDTFLFALLGLDFNKN